ncbi:hypothetical protein IPF37_01020 [bacterium]|nr:MAG: hypothetical protein IPF37_01020 [bacterium]
MNKRFVYTTLLRALVIASVTLADMTALVVGSNTVVSRQNATTFPATDTDNTMLGFAVFEKGFTLGSVTTTCTYNSVFPVSGPVRLAGGTLFLNKDLKFQNVTRIVSNGSIWGNGKYSVDFSPTLTTLKISEATSTRALRFSHTHVLLNANIELVSPLEMRGGCKITGNGYTIKISNGGSLSVRAGSTLLLDNVTLTGVGSTNFTCLTNNATVTFRDCRILLSKNWTFSRGSMLFLSDVMFSGTVQFNYTTPLTSTIASRAMWYFDKGTTFSYAPARARKDLLFMEDSLSLLYLNGASLFSTMTGIKLSTGTLVIDNNVTFSTQARNTGEAPILSNNLSVNLLSGAVFNVYGTVRYS